jgi:FtsZ-interacting cell division protein ZipA
MAISELQIALIGAGAAGVAAVWGYNIWQDRQHRKTADRIFKGGHGDALLPDDPVPSEDPATDSDKRREPLERLEPRFSDETLHDLPESVAQPLEASAAADTVIDHAGADTLPPVEDAGQPFSLPAEFADELADCVLHLAAVEAVPAPAVQAMQNVWASQLTKPVRWLAKSDVDGNWQAVAVDDVGRYREWAVALQLADRRGAVSDGELARFFDGVQQLAQQTSAALELPGRGETVIRAAHLDEFCASVDIQFVLHVVEASGGVFAGTKLRGVAEAAGLVLEADGVFRARDELGGEFFTVANLGAERLDADSIKSLATHGLTLSLDVPRVTNGTLAFDRMLATARQLAATLGGVLVDAQRAPLSDAMIAAIRAKTAELQQRMHDGSIVPGSARALRLFS